MKSTAFSGFGGEKIIMTRLEVGDIILTRGEGLISRIIRRLTRLWTEPKTWVNHSEMVVYPGSVNSAQVCSADRHGVTIRKILPYHAKDRIWVVSPSHIPYVDRLGALVRSGRAMEEPYPVWRLFAYALDWVIGLGLFDVYLFRRFARSGRVRTCSELVAYAWENRLYFGPTAKVTPDDIYDVASNNPNSYIVQEITGEKE